MAVLAGYNGKFALRCWQGADRHSPPRESLSDDLNALRAEAADLVATGEFGQVELAAWNFELNDWVRMETFA